MSPRHSSGSLCNAASACPSGTTTRHAACAVKSWIVGATTPSPAAVAATGSSDTTPLATPFCSAVAEFTSISPELEKPGLLLPRASRTPVVRVSSWILASTLPPQLTVGAAQRTSGSQGCVRFRRGLGLIGFFFAPHLPHLLSRSLSC